MLRLFVTSSQICTLYLSVYAKKTAQPGYIDILIIDYTPKKKGLVNSIEQASKIHNWTALVNLSTPVENEVNNKPSLKKRITRKVKTLPLIKQFYGLLLKRYVKKQDARMRSLVREKINPYVQNHQGDVMLGFLTQTALNNALCQLYPTATQNYFEHGIGDYQLVTNPAHTNTNFYCVFADTFGTFVQKRNLPVNVYGFIDAADYKAACELVIQQDKHLQLSHTWGEKKLVLLLMDAAEIYHVPTTFWTDYLEKCISLIDNAADYHFLVKPHPAQSNEALQRTEDYFVRSGLSFTLIKNQEAMYAGIELFYHQVHPQVHYVFSTFSSALFYMAHFYSGQTTYYFLYDFVEPYFRKGPAQFLDFYYKLDPYFREVFVDGRVKRI